MALFPFPENFPSGYFSNLNPMFAPIDRGADAVRAGNQMIHTDILTWRRRPGKSRWSSVAISSGNSIFDFFGHVHQANARVIVDREETISEFTTASETSFYTKSASQPASFVAVKDKLYFALRNAADEKRKRTGGEGTTKKWGIEKPTVAATLDSHNGSGTRVRIGLKYVYVWKDSTDGHISSRSPISLSTGPAQAGNKIWEVTVRGTDQARVDKIDIYRTVDGGSSLYYLRTEDNPGDMDLTIEDSAADSSLNANIVAPSQDDNNPPPTLVQDAISHVNRIWVIDGDGNVMFNPHSIDGKPLNGVAEECFPTLNTFAYNAPIKLMSSSLGLIIFTQEGIHIITGTSRLDFDPSPLYEGVGISGRHAVCKDGDVFYLYSNTRQILRISDRVEVLGDPISAEDLEDFDPATARLTVSRKGAETALYISNSNNKTFRYNVGTGTWSTVWTSDGAVVSTSPIKSLQTSIGNWDLLYGPTLGTAGFIWKEDSTTNLDDTEPYTAFLEWQLVLADLSEHVELVAVYTESSDVPLVEIRPQEISGTYETGLTVVAEPPLLVDSTTIISKRHYVSTSPAIAHLRHLGMKFTWEADNTPAILNTMGVEFNDRS